MVKCSLNVLKIIIFAQIFALLINLESEKSLKTTNAKKIAKIMVEILKLNII